MRARVEEARAGADLPATREAVAALARWLASRDRDLDEAVDLALEALRGGDDVLCAPFASTSGKRLAFRAAKTQRFGDVLGVIYRKV